MVIRKDIHSRTLEMVFIVVFLFTHCRIRIEYVYVVSVCLCEKQFDKHQ